MRHLTPFVRKFAARLTNKSTDWNQRNRRKMRKSAKKLLLAAFAVLQLMLADETADVSIASRRYVALCTTKVACSFRALVIIMVTDSIAYAAHVVAIRHLPFARPRQTDVRQMTFGFAATARAVRAIDCKMLSHGVTYFAYVFIWWLIRFLGAVDAAVAHALASSAAACWTFFHKVRAIRTTNAACVAIMREQLFLVRLWVLQRRRHNIDGWRLWVLQRRWRHYILMDGVRSSRAAGESADLIASLV